jgi:hypothetical protein
LFFRKFVSGSGCWPRSSRPPRWRVAQIFFQLRSPQHTFKSKFELNIRDNYYNYNTLLRKSYIYYFEAKLHK